MKRGAITTLQLVLIVVAIAVILIVVGPIIAGTIMPTLDGVKSIRLCGDLISGEARCMPSKEACEAKPGWGSPTPLGCEAGGYCCRLEDFNEYYPGGTALVAFRAGDDKVATFRFKKAGSGTSDLDPDGVFVEDAEILTSNKGMAAKNLFTVSYVAKEGENYCQAKLSDGSTTVEYTPVPCGRNAWTAVMHQDGEQVYRSHWWLRKNKDVDCALENKACTLTVHLLTGADASSLSPIADSPFTIYFARR